MNLAKINSAKWALPYSPIQPTVCRIPGSLPIFTSDTTKSFVTATVRSNRVEEMDQAILERLNTGYLLRRAGGRFPPDQLR
jgi:hypothetical protein